MGRQPCARCRGGGLPGEHSQLLVTAGESQSFLSSTGGAGQEGLILSSPPPLRGRLWLLPMPSTRAAPSLARAGGSLCLSQPGEAARGGWAWRPPRRGPYPLSPPTFPIGVGRQQQGTQRLPPAMGHPPRGTQLPARPILAGTGRRLPAFPCLCCHPSYGPWVTATFPASRIPKRVPPQHPRGSLDPLWSLPPAVPHPKRYPLLPRSFQGCERVKAHTEQRNTFPTEP